MCARFQANPKEAHLVAVKRILRYLKHTPSIDLWYPKGALIAEPEYIVVGACAQILYMKQTLLDYGVVLEKVSLLCDNESSVKLANNPVQHYRTKYIDIRHHFLRDHVAKNDISLEGVRTEDQLADIFTKPLDEATFCRLRNELNVLDFSNFTRK